MEGNLSGDFLEDLVTIKMMTVVIIIAVMDSRDLTAGLEDSLFTNLEGHRGFIYYCVLECV